MITGEQLRAAKGILDWSWHDIYQASGVTDKTLMNISKNNVKTPNRESVEKIIDFFDKHDIEIIPGGARKKQDTKIIFYGQDSFLDLLDYAFKTLHKDKGEILFSSAADDRTPPEALAKLRSMREVGIKMRSLIKKGDTCLYGPVEEYRWMPDEIFVDGDAKVIFGDVVAYYITWKEPHRVELTKDKIIAEDAHRSFNFAWAHSEQPTHSTSNIKF